MREPYSLGAVSRDRRYLAFSKTITRDNSDIYLYDTKTGEFKHLTPHEGDINYSPETFSVDSKSLYYLTDEGPRVHVPEALRSPIRKFRDQY